MTEDDTQAAERSGKSEGAHELPGRSLFEALPVALFVEDLSDVKAHVDGLLAGGVTDLEGHFSQHPAELALCAEKVRIIDVNQAALDLYGAADKAELLASLGRILGPKGIEQLAGAIVALVGGATSYQREAISQTLSGQKLEVSVNLALAPDSLDDWRHCFVVTTDISKRVSAQRAAEELARRYQGLVEDQPELMCRFRPDGTLTFVNRAYAEYFGRTASDCVGLDLFELVPRESQDALREHFASFSAEMPVKQMEHAVIKPDGSAGWMQWTNRAIAYSDDGSITELQSIGRDLTDLKKAQENLTESREKFRAVFTGSGVGIGIIDTDRRLVESNEAFAAILGYDHEELVGKTIAELTHPADIERIGQLIDQLAAGDRNTASFEERYIGKDGRVIWGNATISVVRDQNDSPSFFIAMLQDITLRKTMEGQLKASEQRFREISENIREVFWLFDWKEQRQVYVSPAFEEVWGQPVAALLGDNSLWAESIHPLDRDAARETFDRIAETGGGEGREYRITRPDGEVRWICDRGFAVRDDEGQIVRIAGIAEDVTERKRIEAERRQLEAQVREAQKLESLGLLAGGVAHDFNNLLMGVLGNADLALEALPSSSPARPHLEGIEKTARRAADLANQMLAYSGKGRFVVESADLSDVVEEMTKLVRVSVPRKTTLRFDLAPDLPGIEADVTQLRQVVLNLITNASEAIGDEDGAISVETGEVHCETQDLAHLIAGEALEPGRYVFLDVSDSGIGMSEAVQERIFDPFFTTKFTGRGLGMAAVLGIVRGHHGAIQVTSETQRGTSIRVLFPASNDAITERQQAKEVKERWRASGRVLLVDDEPVVRSVAHRMLEHLGFEVVLAEDGFEAVDAFRLHHENLALVILDMAMPRMTGEEAMLEIRRIRDDIPILLSSGYTEHEVASSLSGQGLAGFIQKPYRLKTLETEVRRALEAG